MEQWWPRYYTFSSVSVPNLKFFASTVPEILGGGSQNSKSGSRDPFWPNFADFQILQMFSICEIWCKYMTLADLAAECLFGPILGSFWGFWPLKLWNYCSDPQRYEFPTDTCILRYCVLKSVQLSHL